MRDKLLISFFSDYEGYKMNALLDEDGEQRTLSDIQNQSSLRQCSTALVLIVYYDAKSVINHFQD